MVRHAEAETSGFQTDSARQLTEKGRYDAYGLGVYLRENDIIPEMAICSPAIRTRQTLHGILESISIAYREYPEGLYDAQARHLYEWTKGVESRHRVVLIIGHNPAVHIYARSLAGSLSVKSPERFISYPQGTMTAFDCDCESWRQLNPGKNRLTDYVTPEDYRKLASLEDSAVSS